MDVIQVQQAAVLVGNESILREPHAVQRGILFDSGPFEQFFDQFSRGLRNDVVRVISGTGRFFPCSFQGGPKGLARAFAGPTYVRSPPPGLLDKIVDIVHAATALSERSAERREGEECVSTGRQRWDPDQYKKKQ